MRIIGNVPGITPVYNSKAKVNSAYGAQEVAPKKDELTISSQAKDFATVMNALRTVPDVREEKVAALSGAVESGTYSVSGKDITEKLMASLSAKRI